MALEKNLLWARQQDPIVDSMLNSIGLDTTDCVIALVKQKQELIKRIIFLEGRCPRKIKLPDGQTIIWRCPDSCVPDL